MRRFLKKWVLAGLLAGAVAFGTTSRASAEFTLRVILDGVQQGADITWDGSTTDKFGAAEIDYNNHSFSVTGGDVSLKFTTSLSNEDGGKGYGSSAKLVINGIQISNTSNDHHTLVLETSDSDFSFPQGPNSRIHTTGSATGDNTGSNDSTTMSIVGGISTSNTLFDTSSLVAPTNTLTFAGNDTFGLSQSAANGTFSNTTDLSGNFALTNILTFDLTPGVQYDSAGDVVEVITPVPAGLLLTLSGAPVLGAWHWIRRRRK